MKKEKIKPKSSEDLMKNIRRDWGNVNPATRIIPSKKGYDRKKEKKKGYDNDD